ncbi:sugar kinase [Oceanobacillus sp. HCA-5259]|uniref:sugar kinase n=1 Tax=Oceanobacillus sp. HCA-5259 TaxID=3134661 RepID=UPI0030C2D92A
MIDIVTIGETMVLFYPFEDRPLKYTSLFSKSIAGAESNVAIGLSRLGKKTRWIGRLGEDPFGDIIISMLTSENIDLSKVMRDESNFTSVFFKDSNRYGDPEVFYYRKGSASSKWEPKHVQSDWFEDSKILHMSGITPALGINTLAFTRECMEVAKSLGLTVSFDPNIRYKLWTEENARDALLSLVPLCDIFLPGIEEAKFLLGDKPVEQLAKEFINLGLQTVAIKLGKDGAFGMSENGETYTVRGEKVSNIVDTVGAGDAFATGFLSIVADDPTNFSLKEALTLGNKLGSIVIREKGDWETLPSLELLEDTPIKSR